MGCSAQSGASLAYLRVEMQWKRVFVLFAALAVVSGTNEEGATESEGETKSHWGNNDDNGCYINVACGRSLRNWGHNDRDDNLGTHLQIGGTGGGGGVIQQPVITQPVITQPVIQQPVVQQQVIQQPVVQPVIQQPVVQPVIQQPVVQPVIQQPVIQQPVIQQPIVQPVYVQQQQQPQYVVQQPQYVQQQPQYVVQQPQYVQQQPQYISQPIYGAGAAASSSAAAVVGGYPTYGGGAAASSAASAAVGGVYGTYAPTYVGGGVPTYVGGGVPTYVGAVTGATAVSGAVVGTNIIPTSPVVTQPVQNDGQQCYYKLPSKDADNCRPLRFISRPGKIVYGHELPPNARIIERENIRGAQSVDTEKESPADAPMDATRSEIAEIPKPVVPQQPIEFVTFCLLDSEKEMEEVVCKPIRFFPLKYCTDKAGNKATCTSDGRNNKEEVFDCENVDEGQYMCKEKLYK